MANFTNCWSTLSIPTYGEEFSNIIHAQILDANGCFTHKTVCGIRTKLEVWDGGYYLNDTTKIGCKRCLKSLKNQGHSFPLDDYDKLKK